MNIRVLEFHVARQQRAVTVLQALIGDIDRQAASLDREIHTEEIRSAHSDPSHFAYPMYAKSLIARRENLRRSSRELKIKLDAAQRDLRQAISELEPHTPPTVAKPTGAEGLLAFA